MSCFGGGGGAPEEDPTVTRQRKQHSQEIDQEIQRFKREFESTHRLLLLGAGESGKSTVVKQMVILHVQGGFTKDQIKEKITQIRTNVKDIILAVVQAMRVIDPSLELEDDANEVHRQYIEGEATATDFNFPPVFFEHVEALWKDPGVIQCYHRSNEYQLIDCARYFMTPEKLREIAKPDFKPSEQDILQCRVRTTGILEQKFAAERVKFHLFDVGGQRGERRKWVQCFNEVTAVIFVAACSSYNLVLMEDSTQNRLRESLELFEKIWNNRWLKEVSVILFLNKQDILKEKINEGKFKLESYFPEFKGYQPPSNAKKDDDDNTETLRAKYFIRDMFLRVTMQAQVDHKYVYPYFTTAIDTQNIKRVFSSCKDIIQRLHLKQYDLL